MAEDHLSKKTREVLAYTKDARIDYVQEPLWIPFSEAKRIQQKLKDLYRAPRDLRRKHLFISGDSNNGKTKMVEKFYEKRSKELERDDEASKPLVFVELPPPARAKDLCIAILDELKVRHNPKSSYSQLLSQCLRILQTINLRIPLLCSLLGS